MKDLLAKLEAATEGSRELDEAIATHLFKTRPSVRLVGQPESSPSLKMFEYPDMSVGTALRYTASLDAAMTLVPEGWEWSVGSGNKTEPVQPAYASVWPEEQPFPAELDICTEGATPALALTAAALRARGETA